MPLGVFSDSAIALNSVSPNWGSGFGGPWTKDFSALGL